MTTMYWTCGLTINIHRQEGRSHKSAVVHDDVPSSD